MAKLLTAFFSMTGETYANEKIIPFNTSGGGFGSSIAAIKQFAAGAEVTDGMTVPGTEVEASKAQIQDWAKEQV